MIIDFPDPWKDNLSAQKIIMGRVRRFDKYPSMSLAIEIEEMTGWVADYSEADADGQYQRGEQFKG